MAFKVVIYRQYMAHNWAIWSRSFPHQFWSFGVAIPVIGP